MVDINFTAQILGRYIGEYANLVQAYDVAIRDLKKIDTSPLIDLSGDEFNPIIESEESERKRTIRRSANDIQRAIDKFIEIVPYELRNINEVNYLVKKSIGLIESSEYF